MFKKQRDFQQKYNTFKHIFKDGETCVFFNNDLSNLIEKINYYLLHEKEYNNIVNNAYELIHKNYSKKNLVKKYLEYSN